MLLTRRNVKILYHKIRLKEKGSSVTIESEFWDYGVKSFTQGNVGKTCIKLQDAHGTDSNVILLCLCRRFKGPEAAWTAVFALAETWQRDVLRPMRNVRRTVKEMSAPQLYADIKKTELKTEREQQGALIACFIAEGGEVVEQGEGDDMLAAYLTQCGVDDVAEMVMRLK